MDRVDTSEPASCVPVPADSVCYPEYGGDDATPGSRGLHIDDERYLILNASVFIGNNIFEMRIIGPHLMILFHEFKTSNERSKPQNNG